MIFKKYYIISKITYKEVTVKCAYNNQGNPAYLKYYKCIRKLPLIIKKIYKKK